MVLKLYSGYGIINSDCNLEVILSILFKENSLVAAVKQNTIVMLMPKSSALLTQGKN